MAPVRKTKTLQRSLRDQNLYVPRATKPDPLRKTGRHVRLWNSPIHPANRAAPIQKKGSKQRPSNRTNVEP